MSAPGFPSWRTPRERVVSADLYLACFNQDILAGGRLPYGLACGHLQLGPIGSRRLHCDRCQAIWDAGLDYDGFRNHGHADPLGNQLAPEGQA